MPIRAVHAAAAQEDAMAEADRILAPLTAILSAEASTLLAGECRGIRS
jgi:hypothetical protein